MKKMKSKFVVWFVVLMVVLYGVIFVGLYSYFGKTEIQEIKEPLLGLNYQQGTIPEYFLENNLVLSLSKESFQDLYKQGYFEDGLFYNTEFDSKHTELNVWGKGKNDIVFYYTVYKTSSLTKVVREVFSEIGAGMIKVDIILDPDSVLFEGFVVALTLCFFILIIIALIWRKLRYRNIAATVRW